MFSATAKVAVEPQIWRAKRLTSLSVHLAGNSHTCWKALGCYTSFASARPGQLLLQASYQRKAENFRHSNLQVLTFVPNVSPNNKSLAEALAWCIGHRVQNYIQLSPHLLSSRDKIGIAQHLLASPVFGPAERQRTCRSIPAQRSPSETTDST